MRRLLKVTYLLGVVAQSPLALAQEASPVSTQPASRMRLQLSVDAAVARVTKDHPVVVQAQALHHASQAMRNSVRGRLLPALQILDTHSFTAADVHLSPAFLPGVNLEALREFPNRFASNLVSLTLSQPLFGLMHLSQTYLSADKEAQGVQAQIASAEQDVRARVQTAYLQLFEAEALSATAEASMRSLQEQVQTVKSQVAAGSMTTTDVLRIEVAAANAQQKIIAAQAQQKSVTAELIEMLGLGDSNSDVEFLQPVALQNPPLPMPLSVMRTTALGARPELVRARHHVDSLMHVARAQTLSMLPELSVQAGYMHLWANPFDDGPNRGASDFNADNYSVGASLSWPVWEWGTSYYAQQQAHAQAKAAAAEAQALMRQVATEVAQRHAAAFAAQSAVAVADVAVKSAEEAYRVMVVTMSAGSATTTDLLNAEAARTQARMDLVRARAEAAIAYVALVRAVGDA